MLVGEPVAVDDLLSGAAAEGWSEERLHVAIADRVGQVGRPLALLGQQPGLREGCRLRRLSASRPASGRVARRAPATAQTHPCWALTTNL